MFHTMRLVFTKKKRVANEFLTIMWPNVSHAFGSLEMQIRNEIEGIVRTQLIR